MKASTRWGVMAVAGLAVSCATASVTIVSSSRGVALNTYDSSTGASTSTQWMNHQREGVYSMTAGRSPGGYASHHSVVTPGFIHATMSSLWETTYPSGGGYFQEMGDSWLVTEFELDSVLPRAVMDNGLLNASLTRVWPDTAAWSFGPMRQTTVLELPAGRYVLDVHGYPDSTGSGTLYLPGSGALVLLGLGVVPLVVGRQR